MTCSAIELLLWLLLGELVLVLLLLLVKFGACCLGSFLSGVHPLGIISWTLAGTVIELLLGLLLMVLVLPSLRLLAVVGCGLFWPVLAHVYISFHLHEDKNCDRYLKL